MTGADGVTKRHYTIDDMRQAYAESEGVEFYATSFMVKLIRPISFYFTWLFLRAGITANQTTYLSWIAVLAGCLSYVVVAPPQRWIPLVLVLVWALLDYVDGNIARVTNTRSDYGHFIDVIGAYWFLAFLPFFMAVGLYYTPEGSLHVILSRVGVSVAQDPGLILILGTFAALANILLRLTVMRMQATFGIDPRGNESAPGKSSRIAFVVSAVEAATSPRGFYFPFLVLATVFNVLEGFLAFYFVVYTGGLVAYTTWYVIGLRAR